MVACSAERFIVIADGGKLVERLGRTYGVPVEVPPFLWKQTTRRLEALGAASALRGAPARPYLTDNGNLIVDLAFPEGLEDPEGTAAQIKAVTGVLEHGLFLGLATGAIVATEDGLVLLGSLSPPSRHEPA
jgi:ribose 5-phosphate isomerase A